MNFNNKNKEKYPRTLPEILMTKRNIETVVENFTLTLLFMGIFDKTDYVEFNLNLENYWYEQFRNNAENFPSLWKERQKTDTRIKFF